MIVSKRQENLIRIDEGFPGIIDRMSHPQQSHQKQNRRWKIQCHVSLNKKYFICCHWTKVETLEWRVTLTRTHLPAPRLEQRLSKLFLGRANVADGLPSTSFRWFLPRSYLRRTANVADALPMRRWYGRYFCSSRRYGRGFSSTRRS